MVRRREDEVLNIIKADPLISQKEIADKLGITRSSVGVHVNNLTKKGRIIGRGYVISREDRICIIGGSNIDVWAKSGTDLINGEASEGDIKISVGGVGRNIAENICKLGMQPEFITAISNDEYGKHIQSHSLKEGVRIDKSLVFRNQKTSFFVGLLNEDNKLEYGVSDTSIIKEIKPSLINQKKEEINNCNLIVLDLSLPEETIEFVMSNFKNRKIWIDPVSVSKLYKIKDKFRNIQFLILNWKELSELSGSQVESVQEARNAASILIEEGVEEIVVINGDYSMSYISADDQIDLEISGEEMINKKGVREAQLAALVYAFHNEMDIEECLRFALVAGEITGQSQDVVSPWLNVEKIFEGFDNE